MLADLRRGPFVNDNGDVWVPDTVGGIVAAQRIAYEAAWSRVRFVGMDAEVRMSMHEGVWAHTDGIDEDGDEDRAIEACDETTEAGPCTWSGRAYHFTLVD